MQEGQSGVFGHYVKGKWGLGDEWRVMVVMTLLVILEERRITGASSAG